jgi:hypothetical protein
MATHVKATIASKTHVATSKASAASWVKHPPSSPIARLIASLDEQAAWQAFGAALSMSAEHRLAAQEVALDITISRSQWRFSHPGCFIRAEEQTKIRSFLDMASATPGVADALASASATFKLELCLATCQTQQAMGPDLLINIAPAKAWASVDQWCSILCAAQLASHENIIKQCIVEPMDWKAHNKHTHFMRSLFEHPMLFATLLERSGDPTLGGMTASQLLYFSPSHSKTETAWSRVALLDSHGLLTNKIMSSYLRSSLSASQPAITACIEAIALRKASKPAQLARGVKPRL